jgi:exonuclease SbcC
MILDEVHLKNFRSHRSTKLSFGRGITVIIGGNGAGKTSILDAISFALFKETPDRVTVDELIRLSAKSGEVSLSFHSKGRKYRVRRLRTAKRGAESYFYQLGGEMETLIVSGERDVTSEIEATLGINGELFTSAVYIKQGEIDRLLSSDPGIRKRHIGKLIGTEDMENVHKNFLEIIRAYDKKVSALSRIPAELEMAREQAEKEKQDLAELVHKHEEVEAEIEKKNKTAEEAGKKIVELEGLEEGLKEVERSALELKYIEKEVNRILEYETELNATEEKSGRAERVEKLMEELKKEISYLEVAGDRLSMAKADRDGFTSKKAALKKELDEGFSKATTLLDLQIVDSSILQKKIDDALKCLKVELGNAREGKEKAARELGEKNAALSAVKKAIVELKEAEGTCPVCGSELTQRHKKELNTQYSAETKRLSKNIERISQEFEEREKESSALESRRESISVIKPEVLKEKEARAADAEARISELDRETKAAKDALDRLSPLLERQKSLEDELAKLAPFKKRYIEARGFLRKSLPQKEELAAKVGGIRKIVSDKKVEVDRKVSEFGIEGASLPEVLKSRRAERKELQEGLGVLERKSASQGATIDWKKKRLNELKEEIGRKGALTLELKNLTRFKAVLEKIRRIFHKDVLQRQLRLKARPLIEEYTRDVFGRFNLPYSDVTLTDDFSLKVHGEGGEESIDMLSGGERIAAALALRVGLSRALSGPVMELIILDEPTIHLDAQRRRELVEVIRKLAIIPQTIVVTHDKEFEESADRIIEVEKMDGVSVVRS